MAERVGTQGPEAFEIDTTVPHAARVYDYFLGGTTNFAVDRAAAEQAAVLAGGMDRIRSEVRANRAAETLDLREPVAVMLIGLLHHLRDQDRPAQVAARLMAGMPAGSYLVVSHLASDIHAAGVTEAGELLDDTMEEPLVLRSYSDVAGYFAGLDVVDPGVVQVDEWRPDGPPEVVMEDWTNPLYVGVGRKPA